MTKSPLAAAREALAVGERSMPAQAKLNELLIRTLTHNIMTPAKAA